MIVIGGQEYILSPSDPLTKKKEDIFVQRWTYMSICVCVCGSSLFFWLVDILASDTGSGTLIIQLGV